MRSDGTAAALLRRRRQEVTAAVSNFSFGSRRPRLCRGWRLGSSRFVLFDASLVELAAAATVVSRGLFLLFLIIVCRRCRRRSRNSRFHLVQARLHGRVDRRQRGLRLLRRVRRACARLRLRGFHWSDDDGSYGRVGEGILLLGLLRCSPHGQHVRGRRGRLVLALVYEQRTRDMVRRENWMKEDWDSE